METRLDSSTASLRASRLVCFAPQATHTHMGQSAVAAPVAPESSEQSAVVRGRQGRRSAVVESTLPKADRELLTRASVHGKIGDPNAPEEAAPEEYADALDDVFVYDRDRLLCVPPDDDVRSEEQSAGYMVVGHDRR